MALRTSRAAAHHELADLIKRLGMTTLLATHDLPYALELAAGFNPLGA